MWITHFIQLKLLKGGSNIDTTLTETDLQNMADRVWDHMLTATWQARQLMDFIPHMQGSMIKNQQNNLIILACLKEIKNLIIPLKGAIQDSDRNLLRGRGKEKE